MRSRKPEWGIKMRAVPIVMGVLIHGMGWWLSRANGLVTVVGGDGGRK